MHHSARKHYQSKYPGGKVHANETSVNVYDKQGNHCVAVEKTGAGIWRDASAEYDCKHSHCMAPLSEVSHEGKILSVKEAADKNAVAK